MIELLVKYIQDKGYICDVCPRMLIIRKYAPRPRPWGGLDRPTLELVGVNWMISPVDLKYAYEHVMYQAADRKLEEIEQAIIERCGVQA